MTTDTLDFSPVTAAKIPVAQFAKLCGASRVSAFMWVTGKTAPRGLYRKTAEARLIQVRKALERGALPLPPTPRPKQFDALVQALKKN